MSILKIGKLCGTWFDDIQQAVRCATGFRNLLLRDRREIDLELASYVPDTVNYRAFQSQYISEQINDARLFIWGPDCGYAAMSGWNAFDGVYPDIHLSSVSEFHLIGRTLKSEVCTAWKLDSYDCLSAILFTQAKSGIMVNSIFSKLDDNQRDLSVRLRPTRILYNEQFNFEGKSDQNGTWSCQAYTLLAFARLPVISCERIAPPRAERRRLHKAGKREPDVRIVRLRKSETIGKHTDTTKEWHYRWMVSGHWRKQWHPSTQTHKPQYITAYLKGPDGLPLKPPKQNIFVVNR